MGERGPIVLYVSCVVRTNKTLDEFQGFFRSIFALPVYYLSEGGGGGGGMGRFGLPF